MSGRKDKLGRRATELIRGGAERTGNREHSEAVFLTSSFVFDSAEHAAEQFARPAAEYVYSRFSNPNIKTLNRRVAALEGAESALSFSSGMAAILATVMGACKAGDSVLCGGNVFGATVSLLSNFIAKFNVRVDYVLGGTDEWQKAMRPETRLLILETPSNPLLDIADIAAIADIARRGDALLAVDNCFCPWAQRPLDWGADLVIHSATKYLDGQGRVLGGALAGGEEFLQEKIYPFLRSGGCALSPFSAWTIARGLETLPLRMPAHCKTAASLASWLETQSQVEKVLYTGLPSHPNHALAMRQQNNIGGGIVSLLLKGGRAEAWRFINALSPFSITANFGDAKSTVAHPATTTHARLSPEHRAAAGIGENLVRLSAGLEDENDLKEALTRALAAI